MTTLASSTSTAATHPLDNLRRCLPDLAKHAFKVVLFCVAIAVALWWVRADVRLDIQLVYSLASGIITWAIIDIARFFIDTQSPYHFPRGWRAVALVVGGCAIGHGLGTMVGDFYHGKSTWEVFNDKPRMLVNFFLLSIFSGGAISFFFYSTGKSHYLRSELEASQRQATQAQLSLLQSQLEPHMLFNTLANLRALIQTDPQRATHMLDRLNDYLRSTLSASRSAEHALSAEFDRLRDYLELMAIRMGPRLHYSLDLPAALATTPVPPLILQSLVENAIVHGLEPQVAGGQITISAALHGDMLTLQVADTGVGFDTAQSAEGFGITQVRERLATRYGQQHTIEIIATNPINNGANSGCTVRISIPLATTAKPAAPAKRHHH
jgi:signal transduction histidine kinase